jgi:hypothetical protein
MRETENTTSSKISFVSAIIMGIAIAVVAYIAISASGFYNSFSKSEISKIQNAITHEQRYGKLEDSDWEKLTNLEISKQTEENGNIIIRNDRKGILIFEKDTIYPVESKLKFWERIKVNWPLIIALIVGIEIFITIIYIIGYYDDYYYEEYYGYDEDDES